MLKKEEIIVGDIFTGIVHPATATRREMSAGKRARLGITEGLLRISAGIEQVEDIIADIEQAFDKTEEINHRFSQINTDEERLSGTNLSKNQNYLCPFCVNLWFQKNDLFNRTTHRTNRVARRANLSARMRRNDYRAI